MQGTLLSYFFARVPNLGALILSIAILSVLPIVWWSDESAYLKQRDFNTDMYGKVVSWHKIESAGEQSCVVTANPIDKETALEVAIKLRHAKPGAEVIESSSSVISLTDTQACDGVNEKNVFMLPYLASHATHKANYVMYGVYLWIARFIYFWLMFTALGNVLNAAYARPENELIREQYIKHLKYEKSIKEPMFTRLLKKLRKPKDSKK